MISVVDSFERDKISLRSNKLKPKALCEWWWSEDEKGELISDMMTHSDDSQSWYLTFLLL